MLKTLKKTKDSKFKISEELCEPLENSKKTYVNYLMNGKNFLIVEFY